jgi:hypothetical protein
MSPLISLHKPSSMYVRMFSIQILEPGHGLSVVQNQTVLRIPPGEQYSDHHPKNPSQLDAFNEYYLAYYEKSKFLHIKFEDASAITLINFFHNRLCFQHLLTAFSTSLCQLCLSWLPQNHFTNGIKHVIYTSCKYININN